MAVNNGVITAPVSVSDVRSALGEASTDVGTLCKSAKINKWALYKPVRYASLAPVSDIHRGHNGKCGLVYSEYSGLGALAASGTFLYDRYNDNCAWEREVPQGGLSQPFRLTDFNGYNHAADCFFSAADMLPVIYYDGEGNAALSADIETDESSWVKESDLSIGGKNGTRLSAMYFGAVLFKTGTSTYYVFTAPLGTHDIAISGLSASMAGSYKVGFFWSTAADPTSSVASLVAAPVPCKSLQIMSASSLIVLTVYAVWRSAEPEDGTANPKRTLEFYFTIENKTSMQREVQNVAIVLVRTQGGYDVAQNVTSYVQNFSQTVNAGATWTSSTYTRTVENYDSAYLYGIKASATSAATTYWDIEEDI